MNDYLYKELIIPWIPINDRRVIQKQYTWLIGYLKIRTQLYKLLFVDIVIHTGSPCYRYCVCKHFPINERNDYFNTILCSPRCLAAL